MRGKLYIAYLLFVISMIMPMVPVIPHHHHADGRICMKNDITPDCCSHHHAEENGHCCGDDCVAIHLFEQAPNSDDTWMYDFTPLEVTLFIEPFVDLLSHPKAHATPPDSYYQESLHGTYITRAKGLRAPPCSVHKMLNQHLHLSF